MTATPSQEWTPNDERVVQQNARATDLGYGDEFVYRLSRAFLRLRAENERLTGCNEDLRVTASQWEQAHATLLAEHTKQTFASRATVDALRSQLAATREGETPDGDDGGVPRFENGDPLDEAMYAEWKSSRSRVSDNGK